jgi:hypothetical protein
MPSREASLFPEILQSATPKYKWREEVSENLLPGAPQNYPRPNSYLREEGERVCSGVSNSPSVRVSVQEYYRAELGYG